MGKSGIESKKPGKEISSLKQIILDLEHSQADRAKELEFFKQSFDASVSRYSHLVDDSRCIILEWDPDGNILFLNKWGLDFFGFKMDEIIGRNVVGTIVPPVDTSGRDLAEKMVIVEKSPDEFSSSENENIKKNDERVWIAWTNRGIFDQYGKLVKTISVGIDHTTQRQYELALMQHSIELETKVAERTLELQKTVDALTLELGKRQKAERAMRESEEKFRLAFMTGMDAFYLATLEEGRIFEVNDLFENIFGYTREEVIGKTSLQLGLYYNPSDRASIVSDLKVKGFVRDREVQGRKKDGKIIEVSLSISVLQIENQKHILGIIRDITGQKKARETLQESESRFRALSENSLAGIYIIRDHKFTYLNPAFEKMFKYQPGELLGADPLIVIHPDDQSRMDEILRKRAAGESKPISYEVKGQCKDGETRYVQIMGAGVEFDGRIASLGNVLDITERRLAEQSLKESEEKYRNLVDHATEAIVVAQDGQLKFINQQTKKLLGYSYKELIEMPFSRIIHPDDRDLIKERYRKRTKGEIVPNSYEFRLIRKNGTTGWASLSTIGINWQGKPATLNFLTEITERKSAEEKLIEAYSDLKKSEDKFRLLTEKSVPGIYIIQDAKMAYVNPSFARIFGYTVEEITGRLTPRDLIHADDIQLVMQRLNERIEGKEEKSNFVYRGLRKDGNLIYIEVFGMLMEYQNRPAVMGTMIDVTQRKLAENELKSAYEKLEKTLGDILNTMSKIVETRDPYTAGHQQKVAELAVAIASELHLTTEQINELRMAALIHDIGKIYVPADLLSKPGKLSELEFSLIKTHARYGYDIVKGIDFPHNVAIAVLQHHERLDGSGYPDGLKCEKILFEARIIAVADVVEAMISHRPYRAALGIDVALNEIIKNKNKLYDADIVDACCSVIKNGFSFIKD